MSINISDYKKHYIESASKLVEYLEQDIISVDTMKDPVVLERFHRNAHSLKGESLAMGYIQTGTLSKAIEHIGKKLLEKQLALTPEIINTIKTSLVSISKSLHAIELTNQEVDLHTEIQKLEEFLSPTLSSPL